MLCPVELAAQRVRVQVVAEQQAALERADAARQAARDGAEHHERRQQRAEEQPPATPAPNCAPPRTATHQPSERDPAASWSRDGASSSVDLRSRTPSSPCRPMTGRAAGRSARSRTTPGQLAPVDRPAAATARRPRPRVGDPEREPRAAAPGPRCAWARPRRVCAPRPRAGTRGGGVGGPGRRRRLEHLVAELSPRRGSARARGCRRSSRCQARMPRPRPAAGTAPRSPQPGARGPQVEQGLSRSRAVEVRGAEGSSSRTRPSRWTRRCSSSRRGRSPVR